MGKQKLISTQDKWREKIKTSQVLNRLIQCAEGKLELDKVQAMVSLRLVDKLLPSLQAVTVEQTVNHVGLNRYELDARIIALGEDPKEVWNSLGNQAIVGHKVGNTRTIEHESEDMKADARIIEHEPENTNNDT